MARRTKTATPAAPESAPSPKAEPHKWDFKARFRRHAFGWKSQPAITRIKQAVAAL